MGRIGDVGRTTTSERETRPTASEGKAVDDDKAKEFRAGKAGRAGVRSQEAERWAMDGQWMGNWQRSPERA